MEIGPQSLRWRPWYRKGVIPVSDFCVSTRFPGMREGIAHGRGCWWGAGPNRFLE